MANDMYHYIFVYGREETVTQFQEEALDKDFLISHIDSYLYAWVKHEGPVLPRFREAIREIRSGDPGLRALIDPELGEQLYKDKLVYGVFQWEHLDDRRFCYDKEVLGSLTEDDGNRILLFTFYTAWVENPEIVEDFSRQYPTLDFTLYYIEERQVAENGWMKFQHGRCYESFKAEPYSAEAYWLARKFFTKEEIARHYWYDYRRHRYILR